MLKTKKVITSLMLSAILTVGATVPAFAITSYDTAPQSSRTSMRGSDNWIRGLRDGNNGWYMSYSYYINYSYPSYVKVTLNGGTDRGQNAIGYTAKASKNAPTTYGHSVYCSNSGY